LETVSLRTAWYFWNAETGQVTWTNPLEPAPPLPTEPAPPAPINPPLPREAPPLPEGKFGEIPDIDPDLAYLLPATQRVGGDGQNASFNARTGKFQQTDGTNYAFDHLDEYNRAKRMAGKYFDVDNWEKNLREENAKRKRDEAMGITQDNKITKKDMVSAKQRSLGLRLLFRSDSRKRRQNRNGRNRPGFGIDRIRAIVMFFT
jgi:hypothetical protein